MVKNHKRGRIPGNHYGLIHCRSSKSRKMIKLRYKLGLFNVLSKILFGLIFILVMPHLLVKINTIQTDNELIEKREQVIDIIAQWGVEFFMPEDPDYAFGSYNVLKEEYISLERVELDQHWNFIEVTQRMVENEIIDYRVLNYSFIVDGETYLLEIGKSLTSIIQTQKNIRTYTLVLLILFIILTIITDISFGARLIKPLENITRKLKATTSPARFDLTPVETSTAEFQYLDNTIKDLMVKINELFQKEKESTANISHELLTPVSIIRSQLENILIKPDIDHETATKIDDSLKTLHRLKSMVNSLLLIARVESHQYLKEDNFSVNDIMEEILLELSPMCEDKEIELVRQFKETIRLNKVNRDLIFAMLYNVINNAIKFTPSMGQITITLKRENNTPVVSIKDSGDGMSPMQMEKLFTRFKKEKVHNEKGSGIGLAIAKTIAVFHNITISVDSTKGKGSEFIFQFPA